MTASLATRLLWTGVLASGLCAQVVPEFTPPQASADVLAAYGVSAGTSQALSPLSATPTSLQFAVWIDGQNEVLDLAPHDMRAPDYVAQVIDATGTYTVPAGPNVTYRGSLLGRPDSVVAACYFDGQLRATIWFDRDLPAWGIDPIQSVMPNAPANLHLVHNSADIVLEGTCGVQGGIASPIDTVPTGTDILEEAQALIICDAQFAAQYSNNTTTIQNVTLGVMNAVDVIYDRDVEITYDVNIVQIFIGSDVFTTNLACSQFQTNLLSQFQAHALTAHAGVQRDINHLFSGRNFSGSTLGCAWDGFSTGTVCTNTAYGVSDMNSVQGQTFRAGLVSHEMGHNWHAQHCSDGGGCRIMCDGLGGCSGIVSSFDATAIAQITAFKNTINCLTNAGGPPPVLNTVAPSVIEVLGGQVQLQGSNLTATTAVKFIGFELGAGEFTVVNDTLITIDSVLPPNLNPNFIWVVADSMSSNLLPVGFQPAADASLEIPQFHSPVLADWPVDYAHQPGYFYALFGSLNNPATVPVLGIDFLVGAFQISSGSLDPVTGIGQLEIDIVPGSLVAQSLFMQLVTIDTGFTTVFSSPIEATFFLN